MATRRPVKQITKREIAAMEKREYEWLLRHVDDEPPFIERRGLKHGLRYSDEYRVWCKMKERCYNKKCEDYPRWGGRGIKVCDEWKNNPSAFISHIGKRPSKLHSIDRIDNSGDYAPGNVRWATYKQQANNTRRMRLITFKNKTMSLTGWANKLGMNYSKLRYRLNKGWELKHAFSKTNFKTNDRRRA
jgi:hypothetical protein